MPNTLTAECVRSFTWLKLIQLVVFCYIWSGYPRQINILKISIVYASGMNLFIITSVEAQVRTHYVFSCFFNQNAMTLQQSLFSEAYFTFFFFIQCHGLDFPVYFVMSFFSNVFFSRLCDVFRLCFVPCVIVYSSINNSNAHVWLYFLGPLCFRRIYLLLLVLDASNRAKKHCSSQYIKHYAKNTSWVSAKYSLTYIITR